MSLIADGIFRMTIKTRIFLFLYRVFNAVGQWFIKHCDMEEASSSC